MFVLGWNLYLSGPCQAAGGAPRAMQSHCIGALALELSNTAAPNEVITTRGCCSAAFSLLRNACKRQAQPPLVVIGLPVG
jgi:hypothetical protein